ncbi:MAG: hypothetical protein ACRDOH_31340 [Streptosporangiaceae bacterium]
MLHRRMGAAEPFRRYRQAHEEQATSAPATVAVPLLHDGRTEEHRLSPGLRRRDDGLLVYDAGQRTLL